VRRPPPALLLALGCLLLALVAAALLLRGPGAPETVTTTVTTVVTTTVPAPAPPPPATTEPPAAPSPVPMSWSAAGGLVWHVHDVDPTLLGERVRAAGFGWVAIMLADGLAPTQASRQWVDLFRAASGLPVGGWSVLRDRPVAEARLAAAAVAADGLDFFVADAEREYEYTNGADRSDDRYARSRRFVDAFRAAEPELPAGLSSYCNPSLHDLDWGAWAGAGFVFLPQAYVSALGPSGTPGSCAGSASRWFPRQDVHPTIGIFGGRFENPSPEQYGELLAQAGTTGFSLYPAETAGPLWEAYGAVIRSLGVATLPGAG
jgi:hypothetical protein